MNPVLNSEEVALSFLMFGKIVGSQENSYFLSIFHGDWKSNPKRIFFSGTQQYAPNTCRSTTPGRLLLLRPMIIARHGG